MATKANLGKSPTQIFVAEDRNVVFTVVDDDGVAVDITGWAVSFVSGVVTLTVGSGITLTTPASGILTVVISSANTTLLLGSGDYKLRRTDSGFNTVLSYGTLVVTA